MLMSVLPYMHDIICASDYLDQKILLVLAFNFVLV